MSEEKNLIDDSEEDLIEEISCASGWCIRSIDYRHVLS